MKLTNDYRKLFVIAALIVGFLTTLYFVANVTRLDRSPTIPVVEQIIESDEHSMLHGMNSNALFKGIEDFTERVRFLYSLVSDAKDQYAKYAEAIQEGSKTSMSAKVLYTNYAYEIAKFSYPDIDPEYVCAIIVHESRFDPYALNKATNAQGLTQILPKWHSERAKKLGVTSLYDPHGNILVCFDILHELTEAHNFEYALNFFAGGYRYANRFRNRTSPFIRQLNEIIEAEKFSDYVLPIYFDITMGGETDVAS